MMMMMMMMMMKLYRIKLYRNPEKLIIEKKPTTVIYKRTTLSAKATSSL